MRSCFPTDLRDTSIIGRCWHVCATRRAYAVLASAIRRVGHRLRQFDAWQLNGLVSRFTVGLGDDLRAIARARPRMVPLSAGECFYSGVGLVLAAIFTYGMWDTKPSRHVFYSPSGQLCADQSQACSDAPTALPMRRVSLTQRVPSLTRHDAALTVPHRAPHGQFRYPGVWFTQPVHRVFYSDAGHLCTDQVVLHLDGHRASTCP